MSITFTKYPSNSAVIAPLRPSLKVLSGELSGYDLISVSRDSIARYWDEDGNVGKSEVDKIESSFDPVSGSRYGWPIMGGWTNDILDPRDMTTGNWGGSNVARNAVGIDAQNNTACTITDNSGGVEFTRQDVSIPDNSDTHTMVLFVKKESASNYIGLGLVLQGGTTEQKSWITFDQENGTFTDRNVSTVSPDVTIKDVGSFYRVSLSVSNNATGNTIAQVQLYPAVNTDGSNSWVGATTGSAVFDAAQVFLNRSTTPPAPVYGETAGQVFTKSPDNVTLSVFSIINTRQGTFKFTFRTANGSGTQTLFDLHADANNRIYAERNASDEIHFIIVEGGTTQADLNLGTVANDTEATLVVGYKKDDITASLDGGAEQTDSSATIPTTTALNIMRDYNDANYWNGYLKEARYWEVKRPNLNEL